MISLTNSNVQATSLGTCHVLWHHQNGNADLQAVTVSLECRFG